MNSKQLVAVSKFLSKHLRHAPEELGLTLEPGGWVAIETLLAACVKYGFPISREQLDEVVRTSDKKRYSYDDAGTRIRANQGHSTDVDLQRQHVKPPALLYHGTAEKNVTEIFAFGLLKMKRHHVHLSLDTTTATKVGQRHGKPIILAVDSAAMHARGHLFYCSFNGVWLTDHVPAEFLRVLDEK